jgi:hypothetical protein
MTFTTEARFITEKAATPVSPAAVTFIQGINRGVEMAKITYAEQLGHPNWQRVRLRILERADWQCEECGNTDKQLHVHHKFYIKGRMVWEYSDDELMALCKDCHKDHHESSEHLARVLADVYPSVMISIVAGYKFAMEQMDAEEAEKYFKKGPLEFMCGYGAAALDGCNPVTEHLEPILFSHSGGRFPSWLKKSKA